MAIGATPTVERGGTIAFEVALKNENDNNIATSNIDSIKWTLWRNHEIVNDREDVSADIANPVTITLSGDDLVPGVLTLEVNVQYDSDLGDNLPLKSWETFKVKSDLTEDSG